MKFNFRIAMAATALAVAVGCSDSNDPAPTTGGPAQPSFDDVTGGNQEPIAGLWDITRRNDVGFLDSKYVDIAENGDMTVYDYDQDEAGEGSNCYNIIEGQRITNNGGGNYSQSDRTLADDLTFNATFTALGMTVSFLDVFDINENLESDDVITVDYRTVRGLTATDLSPEC